MTKKIAPKSTGKPVANTANAPKPAARASASAAKPGVKTGARSPSTATIPIPPPSEPIPEIVIPADTSAGSLQADGKSSAAIEAADRIIAGNEAATVSLHVEQLASEKSATAAHAGRVLEELLARKPELLVPSIEKFVQMAGGGSKRAALTAAMVLPVMAKLAPSRVARYWPALSDSFAQASEEGKTGMVNTFAALCIASVAYQKRLEPVLELALSTADPKTLLKWTEIVLPALKGEPHARARAVVEDRLASIPRAAAQPIATFLGIKLRPIKA
jgi:hypothetical protein